MSGRMRIKVAPQYATHWLGCRVCIGCRDAQAATWTTRLTHETRSHSHNIFLTLTYDDNHLPNGLQIPHLQKFWKRLRKRTKNTLKYFACGEYGDRTKRPHYHAAIFGLNPFGDEKKYDMDNNHSETLTQLWGHGQVLIAELTPPRMAYVAGYVMKKAGHKKQIYCDEDGVEIQAPFRKMSNGLGAAWLGKYMTDLRNGFVQNADKRKIAIPRYYTDILKTINHGALHQQIQEQKDKARAKMEAPIRDRCKAGETIRMQQIKKAKRDKN